MGSDSAPPSRAGAAFSAGATGGVDAHRPSLSGRPPGIGKIAVYFHDRWLGCGDFAPATGFTGQTDVHHAQRTSGRDG